MRLLVLARGHDDGGSDWHQAYYHRIIALIGRLRVGNCQAGGSGSSHGRAVELP